VLDVLDYDVQCDAMLCRLVGTMGKRVHWCSALFAWPLCMRSRLEMRQSNLQGVMSWSPKASSRLPNRLRRHGTGAPAGQCLCGASCFEPEMLVVVLRASSLSCITFTQSSAGSMFGSLSGGPTASAALLLYRL
jgi:hypothetical protein